MPASKTRAPDRRGNPWNAPKPLQRFDIKAAERFETVEQARKEAGIRIAMLAARTRQTAHTRFGRHCKAALKTLRSCRGKTKPCMSIACPRCMRQHRRVFVAQVLEYAQREGYRKIAFVTLLASRWNGIADLDTGMNAARMAASLRYHLQQAGFKGNLAVMGAIDCEYDQGWFNAHFHLFIPYQSEKVLKQCEAILRDRFYNQAHQHGVKRPMEIRAFTDEVGYILNS